MNQDIFKNCIKLLKTTKSDNEVLAALLTITKVIKADEADLSTSKIVFDAVGTRFMKRLLLTGSASDDGPDSSFKCVAVSMLACFCAVPGFVKDRHTELKDLLPLIASITYSDISGSGDTEESRKLLVSDCHDCLANVASDPQGRESLIASGCVSKLCQAISQKSWGDKKAVELLLYLCSQCGVDTWRDSHQSLLEITAHFTEKLTNLHDDEKFRTCTQLTMLMHTINEKLAEVFTETAIPGKLKDTLFHLLQNKLGQEQRARVLELCAATVDTFGVTWALDAHDTGHKFLLLMVHMACIEVRINLEIQHIQQVVGSASLLGVCYGLLERVIEYLTAGPSLLLDSRQVAQLHSAMVGAFNAVIQFLDRAATELDTQPVRMAVRPVVVASVRVLGSWIAEETSALRSEVIAILPFLIEIGQETFLKSKELASSTTCGKCDVSRPDNNMDHGATDIVQTTQTELEALSCNPPVQSESATHEEHTTQTSGPAPPSRVLVSQELRGSFSDVEVMQFLMPGLCHLTADDQSRRVLLDHGLTPLLLDYLRHQWRRRQGEVLSPGNNKDPGVAMTSVCGTILNVVATESHLVQTDQVFGELYFFVLETFPKLLESGEDSLTSMMMIGLLIFRRRFDNNDIAEDSVWGFMRQSIEMLMAAHSASGVEGAKMLTWAEVWRDYTDLWGLALQVISECLALVKWLPAMVLDLKWHERTCKVLLQVTRESVPEDVVAVYQDLLLALARTSQDAAKALTEAGVSKLTRKYQTAVSSTLTASLK